MHYRKQEHFCFIRKRKPAARSKKSGLAFKIAKPLFFSQLHKMFPNRFQKQGIQYFLFFMIHEIAGFNTSCII